MTKIDDRLAKLEATLKQIKAKKLRQEAKARSVALNRSRREEMRRKFLVGAIVLAKVEDGSLEETVLKEWLRPAISKPEDRALFGLDA